MKHAATVVFVGLMVVGVLGQPGCAPAPSKSSTSQPTAPTPSVTASSSDPTTPAPVADLEDREIWEICYIQGAKVGFARTRIKHVQRDGRPVVRIEWFNRLAVQRFGERTEVEIRLTSHETHEGQLIDFESEMAMGAAPIQTRGRVQGEKLLMETIAGGEKRAISIPWSPQNGGFHAVERTLLAEPMRPGQRRSLRTLIPNLNQVATVELIARDFESVQLLTGTHRLLRIESKTRFSDAGVPGAEALDAQLWVNRTGEVLKTHTAAMGQEIYRATKAEALDESGIGELDLGFDLAVPLDRPLARPHQTRRVRYRVRLKDGDPARLFVEGHSQAVKSIDANTAEITVAALRPGSGDAETSMVVDPPMPDDLNPNSMIQSDDPTIVAMAREAVGDEKDAWSKAVALERFVHDTVEEKNFSQAFATAAEVAQSREGDCTEHAVLLAALARAVGLPSRVAIGLVYMQPSQSFGYHMWTEVYLDERWIPLDGTLAEGGIGAAHLKLAHANLKDAGGFSSFLPVVQVMGRMKIEVVEAE